MKERPILFSAPMVRALLDGSKTQTRRVAPVSRLDLREHDGGMVTWGIHFSKHQRGILSSHSGATVSIAQAHNILASQFCPYGSVGDQLWVREAFAIENTRDYEGDPGIVPPLGPVKWEDEAGEASYRYIPRYRASEPDTQLMIAPSEKDDIGMRWKPSIHMPRWASRILLEITDVRVERLQDISEADCIAEGMRPSRPDDEDARHMYSPRWAYEMLWNQINGLNAWDANPWVWAVSFRPLFPGEHGRAA